MYTCDRDIRLCLSVTKIEFDLEYKNVVDNFDLRFYIICCNSFVAFDVIHLESKNIFLCGKQQ